MRALLMGIGLLLAGTFLYNAIADGLNWVSLVLGMAFLYGSIFCIR